MTETNKTPMQLADEHWAYIETIILEDLRMKMLLYKTAFIHGYRHGKDGEDGIRTESPKKS